MESKTKQLLEELEANIEPNEKIKSAGRSLTFRDFLSVALVIPSEHAFPDNWIYIHEPDVKVGRVQNYGSWSPYLVKEGKTCLGLEYFVNIGDELWTCLLYTSPSPQDRG